MNLLYNFTQTEMYLCRLVERFWWRTQSKANRVAAILLGLPRWIESIERTPLVTNSQAWSLCFLLRFFLIFYAYGQWCRPLGESRLTLCFILDLQCGCVIQERLGSTEPVDILSSFYARRAVSLLLQLASCGIPQILRTYPRSPCALATVIDVA